MRQSRTTLAVTAVLIAAVSFSVFARTHSGGGRSIANHPSHSARSPVVHVARPRHFARHAAVGLFVGAAVATPLFIPAPRYYYLPTPRYVAPAPSPAYWYYCSQLNAYYPYVQECPGPWQPVMPQPPY